MADRYVIPAGGNSNTTATWSTTDGGAGGASIPVSGDTVRYTATAGPLVWTGTTSFDNLICTGATATMSGSGALNILGDTYTLGAGMTFTATGTRTFTGANAAGDITITSAGLTTPHSITINGSGKNFKLADALNIGASNITVTTGNLDYQGFSVTTTGTVTLTAGSIDADVCTTTQGTLAVTSGTYSHTNGTLNLVSGGTGINSANGNTRAIVLTGTDVLTTGVLSIFGTGLTWAPPDLVRFTRPGTNTATVLISANTGDAFPLIEISQAVTGPFYGFTLSGNADIGELAFVGVANANWIGAKIALASDITIDKCSFSAGTEIISSANGTPRSITTNTDEITFDQCMIRDIVVLGLNNAIATNSIDLGGNGGITFTNFGAVTSHEISGITYENVGPAAAVLPSCTVIALKEDGGVYKEVSRTVSDGTTGAYTLGSNNTDACLLLGIKAGESRGDGFLGIVPVPV